MIKFKEWLEKKKNEAMTSTADIANVNKPVILDNKQKDCKKKKK